MFWFFRLQKVTNVSWELRRRFKTFLRVGCCFLCYAILFCLLVATKHIAKYLKWVNFERSTKYGLVGRRCTVSKTGSIASFALRTTVHNSVFDTLLPEAFHLLSAYQESARFLANKTGMDCSLGRVVVCFYRTIWCLPRTFKSGDTQITTRIAVWLRMYVDARICIASKHHLIFESPFLPRRTKVYILVGKNPQFKLFFCDRCCAEVAIEIMQFFCCSVSVRPILGCVLFKRLCVGYNFWSNKRKSNSCHLGDLYSKSNDTSFYSISFV